jgi:gamma-glutamyltranspeptidase/glutathione hydrolase
MSFLRNAYASSFFSLLFLLSACSPPDSNNVANDAELGVVTQDTGMAAIAMPDQYAAEIADNVLKSGGNAVDAAVAVGFSLAVTYPEAGNIGGGGFMLVRMEGESSFIDYRERAPAAADRDMYLDEDGNVIEGASLYGHLAVGVPGTVAGMWEAHKRFGTLPWASLLQPAVDLATDGFVVPDSLGSGMKSMQEEFAGRTNFDEYFGGMQEGVVFRQPELAATLARIAEFGPDDFYRGDTAELIVAEMARGDGLITMQDLADYSAVWREPLRVQWRDFEVVSAPLPSSGGIALVQLLKIKDYINHYFEDLPHNSPQYIHLVAEIEKRVFADRAEFLGDPDFVQSRMAELTSDEYIQRRALEVNPDSISMGVQPGANFDEHDTTHFSILDKRGNAVSNTYTLNISYGSGVVVTGGGFLLNDEMDDFSVKPGVPNTYGVLGSRANAIEPGKRMLSSMTPTILLKDNEVAMVLGTPGGSTIFTSVFQTIVNVKDFGMTPADAVGATRFHHQLLPADVIVYSPGRPLPESTISALADKGYRAIPNSWEFGDMQVIYVDGDDTVAASDPRNRGESRVIE